MYGMSCRVSGGGACACWPAASNEAGALRAIDAERAADAGTAIARKKTAAIAPRRAMAIDGFTIELR